MVSSNLQRTTFEYEPGQNSTNMKRRSIQLALVTMSVTMVLTACMINEEAKKTEAVNLRLQWTPHSQFAGYIIALKKGYYKDEGLDVTLLPGGPDLKPHVTVASGSDQFGVGVPNQVISARANGVPLVVVAQFFQDSPNRYILKGENHIDSLQQLRGQKVGLWMGGDEAEFTAMLATAGMKLSDVQVVDQGFTVAPFLQDEFKLSMVTTYMELGLVQDEYKGELQILSPKAYHAAILGDMLFTTEAYLKQHPQTVEKVLSATIRGWRYALEHPSETVDLMVAYNPELDRVQQVRTLRAISDLVTDGDARTKGLGYINPEDYETAARVLRGSGQLSADVVVSRAYDMSAWNAVPDSLKLPR